MRGVQEMKKLICFLIGHKKFNCFDGYDILTLNDREGKKLVSINVCKRCGGVYSDLYEGEK